MAVRTLLVASATFAALSFPASAQEWFQGGWAVQMGQTGLMTQALNRPLARYSRQQGASPRRSLAADLTRTAAPGVQAHFDGRYRVDAAVRRNVENQFIAFVERQSPGDVDGLRRELARRDFVESWRIAVSDLGLSAGDVTDAMASYLLINWAMANGGDAERAEAHAVRAQIRRVMALDPSFASLSDSERQGLAETLMLNFLVQQAAFADALRRGDMATQRRMGEAARARFQSEFGMDLLTFDLTPNGLSPRR